MVLFLRRGAWYPSPGTNQRPLNASPVLGIRTKVLPWPKDLYSTGGRGALMKTDGDILEKGGGAYCSSR